MNADDHSGEFYDRVPAFDRFTDIMDPALYRPLPAGWWVGVADVVQSTRAIREHRYKAVNMAGAAVIAAMTNALGGRDFPFVFGGDGATFAVSPDAAAAARDTLAATAAWVRDELDLGLRVALVPVEAIRAHGCDVRVARFRPSPNVSYAMFSGGGLAWADAALKRGEYAVVPSARGVRPDLSGLSCRFAEIPAMRGMILSLLVLPAPGAHADDFRSLIESITQLVESSPDAARPFPNSGPPFEWPPKGIEYEARASRHVWIPLLLRRLFLLFFTFGGYFVLNYRIPMGLFNPTVYFRELVENSDFRKYDDALRMVIDCTPALAETLERRLAEGAAAGVARFGMHRQDKAMMTCFAPSMLQSNHVHFIDGADGGYALAAGALKAAAV